MDLTFQPSQLSYLNCILQTVQSQEETGEMVVPDSLPDILSIVDSYADAMIRGKECRNGSLLLSGGIKGGILYLPADRSFVRCLDFYLPFTMKIDNSALTEQSQVICDLKVRSVDGCTINSRKAMLRANLSCMLTAYESSTETLLTMTDPPDCLETKQTVYALKLPVEYAEKGFTINDLLEPALGQAPVSQVCKLHNDITLQEQNLVGDKAVFKGVIACKMLYLGEDCLYHICRKSIPFSQYCELQQEYDNEKVEVCPMITGCNWEAESREDGGQISVSIQLLAQCLVSGIRELTMTEDAFCLHGQLTPQWTPYDFHVCLDQLNFRQTVNQTTGLPCKDPVDADVYIGFPSCNCQNNTAQVTTPLQIHLLGYDEKGALTGTSEKAESCRELALTSGSKALAQAILLNSPDCHPTADGLSVSCDLAIAATFYADQTLTSLTGGEIEPSKEKSCSVPSIILRKFGADTALWQIAKQYRARTDTIRCVNHLDGDILIHSQMLLIPIS